MENDSQTTSPGPAETAPPSTEPGSPATEVQPDQPSAADPPRARRRRQAPPIPPWGTIDFFAQEPADGEPTPPMVTSADFMALTRELRRLQTWSPDNPETRDAMRTLLEAALGESLGTIPDQILPLAQAQETAVATLEALIRDAAEEAARRTRATEATLKSVQQQAQGIVDATRKAMKEMDDWLEKTRQEVAKKTSGPWWKHQLAPLGTAAVCGTLMVLLLTGLRPGWTLTRTQREALRIGESVSEIYLSANPADQAEMRRVNRWRASEAADTTTAPPQRHR